MAAVVILSLTLLGLAGYLIDAHRRNWHEVCNSTTATPVDKRFARIMFYRRMAASGTIALIGAAIAVGPAIPRAPLPMSFYLASLLGACILLMLLAIADIWATRQHFRRLRQEQLAKQLELTVELARLAEASDGEG